MDSILVKIGRLRTKLGELGVELEMDENFPVEILRVLKNLDLPSLSSIQQSLVDATWDHIKDDLVASLWTAIFPRSSSIQESIAKRTEYSDLTDRLNKRVSRVKKLAQRPGNEFLGVHLCKHAVTKLLAMDFAESLICGSIYTHLLFHVMVRDGRPNWEVLRALGNDDQHRFVRWKDAIFSGTRPVRRQEFGHTFLYHPQPMPQPMIAADIPVCCTMLSEDDSVEIAGAKGLSFGASLKQTIPSIVRELNVHFPFGNPENPLGEILDVVREIQFFAERLQYFVEEVHPWFARLGLSDEARRGFFRKAREGLLSDY